MLVLVGKYGCTAVKPCSRSCRGPAESRSVGDRVPDNRVVSAVPHTGLLTSWRETCRELGSRRPHEATLHTHGHFLAKH